jgi:hypothetical protein
LRIWRDQWVARIADLYMAHRGIAAAEPGGAEHTQASGAFERALNAIDTVRREQAGIHSLHPAAKKVLATLDREWDGLARHRDFPDIDLDNYADIVVMPISGRFPLVGAVPVFAISA